MNQKPIIIAHRGASGDAPENTLSAIKMAMEAKADMIEFDIHQSKDGELIVIHDETVDRTTNGTGKVNEKTLDELRILDAGSWFSAQFEGEPVPTLQEVIDLVSGHCKLLIEVKGTSKEYSGIEQKLIDVINKNNCKDWCIVQSFNASIIEQVQHLDSTINTHKLLVSRLSWLPWHMDDGIRWGSAFNLNACKAFNPSRQSVSKGFVNKVHGMGKQVFCWTVNEADEMNRLLELGVDGIITNYPAKLRKAIDSKE